MSGACPSDLRLEHHLLDPAEAGIMGHVAGCARCASRLAQMRHEGEAFEREVYPATVEAVVAAASAERPGRRRWMTIAVPFAAAAAVALALLFGLRPHPPGVDLSVYVSAPGGARPVATAT